MVIDRKRTEAALREVNQLTSEVISGVNTGIIVYDRDARHLIWNRYMEQMTGLSKDTMLGRAAPEIVSPVPRFQYTCLSTAGDDR